jgi:RNA polymerase sigma factor (sigma-70 family)
MPSSGQDARPDAELLLGDGYAFAAFYRRHEDALLRFFLRRTGEPELAADLTAEAFARSLSTRASFNPQLGDAGAWLFGIARHLLAASLERGRVEDNARLRLGMEPLVLGDDSITRIDELGDDRALAALETLPAEQHDAVTGRVIDERAYADLATQLQCSQSVVRQRVSRGLRTLRAQLKEER